MAVCDVCDQEMHDVVGCSGPEYDIKGEIFRRRAWEGEERCHDCWTPPGALHHPGCDSETCPRCGGQAIGCGCNDEEDLGGE